MQRKQNSIRACLCDSTTCSFSISAFQLVRILGALHERGIIYRDLKASNVILEPNGRLQLIDFGFAKYIGMRGRTRSFCGTLHAMPPEVLANGRRWRFFSDDVVNYGGTYKSSQSGFEDHLEMRSGGNIGSPHHQTDTPCSSLHSVPSAGTSLSNITTYEDLLPQSLVVRCDESTGGVSGTSSPAAGSTKINLPTPGT